MAKVTRRKFIQGASAGAAAVGMIAAGPAIFDSQSRSGAPRSANRGPSAAPQQGASRSSQDALAASTSSEPIMAYVRDPAKGEVAIFVGAREIIRQDPELAARLVRATA